MGQSKKKIAINSVTNVGFHFLRLFIAIFMTPFLLSRLGPEVYGIMPLVNSCIAFVILASGGIQNSVGRYFTLHLAKKEYQQANRYASTAFVLLARITTLAVIPFVIFAWVFPDLLDIPAGHEMEARIVVLLLGLNVFIPIVFSPFTVGLYAQQRFDLKNLVSFFTQILYVALVVGTFIYIETNIIYLAAATVFSNLLATVQQARLSKRLVPTLKISPRLFDRSKLKEVGTYSFWIFVTQINILLFLNTDYIIINQFLDSTSVTGYSLVARWNEMIRSVVMAAVGVVTPLITELEAKENFARIRALMTRGLRLVLVLVTPPAVLLTLFSKELLTVWVGPEYVNVAPVFWASVLPLLLILSAMPAQSVLTGMGKVKWVAIVNLFSAGANLFLSIGFIVFLNLGILGVALGSSCALLFKNLIFVPFYAARVVDLPARRYFKEFIRPILGLIPMSYLAIYLQSHFALADWLMLLSASALCTALYAVTAYFLIFNAKDKNDVKAAIRKVFSIKKGNTMTTQTSFMPFFKKRRSRRFQIYCVGAAKTGTTTIAAMFKDKYRADHEPETQPTNQFVIDYLEGKTDAKKSENYLLARDRRLNLELESAHPLGYSCGLLATIFPEAKFIITLREPYSWLQSRLNYHYQKDPVDWRSYRKYFWTDRQQEYPAEEKHLAKFDLCNLDVYLEQYADHYRRVFSAIPASRRLLVKTHELEETLPAIAEFAGIPQETLQVSHSKQSPDKIQPLQEINPLYIREKIWQHCSEIINQFFPETVGEYVPLPADKLALNSVRPGSTINL